MKAIYNIPYGLYILTTKSTKMNGCMVNTVQQVTSSPNRISVAVNKENFTCSEIQKTKKFNVSILDKTTTFDLIQRFGFSSGSTTDKFADFSDYAIAKNGLPYLTKNSNAYISASVVQEIDLGTHIMFIADVEEDVVLNELETMTYSYYLSNVKPKVQAKKVCYVCRICGYVYNSDTLPEDYICPICKHDSSAFDKVDAPNTSNTEAKKEEINEKKTKKYICPTCGYVYEGDNPPEICPICKKEMVEQS